MLAGVNDYLSTVQANATITNSIQPTVKNIEAVVGKLYDQGARKWVIFKARDLLPNKLAIINTIKIHRSGDVSNVSEVLSAPEIGLLRALLLLSAGSLYSMILVSLLRGMILSL